MKLRGFTTNITIRITSMKNIKSIDQLFSANGIEIPLIQRDYVQGRVHEITNKTSESLSKRYTEERNKRNKFVTELLTALLSGEPKNLTFIYGIKCKNDKPESHDFSFMPIDGQQRLTTLFLLCWYVHHKVSSIEVPSELLKGLKSFRFKTRPTSDFFCECLFAEGFKHAGKDRISENIKAQPWFGDNWEKDPSVYAMLQMLDEIERQIIEIEEKGTDLRTIAENLYSGHIIQFEILDMKEYKLTDALYVKMNARGKPLTEFEILKAKIIKILREEFKDVEHKGVKASNYFEHAIEHDWTNLLWAYCRKEIENEDIKYPVIDRYFLNLFDSFVRILYSISHTDYDSRNIIDLRHDIIANQGNLILIFEFLDILYEIQQYNPALWQNLFYVTNNNSSLQRNKVRLIFPSGDNNNINLLDRCIIKDPRNFDIMMLYAILMYCRRHGISYSDNMYQYTRIVRNWLTEKSLHTRNDDVKVAEDLQLSTSKSFNDFIESHINNISSPENLGEYETLIEDFDFIKRRLNSKICDEFNYGKALYDALLSFDKSTSDDKRCVLVANGFTGTPTKYCAHGQCRFFGSDEKWDFLFTVDKDTFPQAFVSFVRRFSQGDSIVDQINSVLDEKETNKTFDFVYYFLKYPKYRNVLNKDWIPNFYFSVKDLNILDIMGLGHYSKNPLRSYHSDPMTYTISEELKTIKDRNGSILYMASRCMGNENGDLLISDTKSDWSENCVLLKVEFRPETKQVVLRHMDKGIETSLEYINYENKEQDIVQLTVKRISELFPNNKFEDKY